MSEFKTIAEPAAVICPKSLPISRAYECEFTLNIGMFFDGTDNNRHTEPSKFTNTNIVRLWEAYKDDNDEGFYANYVSGVGTPFTEIGEEKAPGMGAPFGAGGEARIVYGLLQVINSVHGFINANSARFGIKQLAALCSDTKVPTEIANDALGSAPQRLSPPQQILADLGLSQGPVDAGEQRFLGRTLRDERRDFITRIAAELAQQLATLTTRPRVSAIYLDVFGFSRGAAQARVFTTWLHDLMLGRGQLFGVPSYVRMLGLFDTVSSVGLTGAAASHGHHAWATARNLRIHPEVRNCVHYVALHELRTNFPCDSVGGPEGVLPPNVQEHYCPGAHSDVGGGYAPGMQGKGGASQLVDPRRNVSEGGSLRFVPDDSRKLSQLPLNTMWEAANKACELHEAIPWVDFDSVLGRQLELHRRFAMARDGYGRPLVARAVASYFDNCGVASGLAAREALREHGLRYLAWRYQVTRDDAFEKLPSVTYARMLGDDPKSLAHYRKGQALLAEQIKLLSTRAPLIDFLGEKDTRNGFSRHAPEIFERMKTLRLGEGLYYFFDAWVHDSYAGFIGKFDGHGDGFMHQVSEGERYVRWRGIFCGSDEQLNALRRVEEDGQRVT
jgi:hypothetical protein